MRGAGPVRLEASQPKNVGLLLSPRFTNVLTSGTGGKAGAVLVGCFFDVKVYRSTDLCRYQSLIWFSHR